MSGSGEPRSQQHDHEFGRADERFRMLTSGWVLADSEQRNAMAADRLDIVPPDRPPA